MLYTKLVIKNYGDDVMTPFYIINEDIEFIPDENTLRNIHQPEKITTLNTPAARCLQLLLSQSGLVTHQEFYEKAWVNARHETLPNTLYQNILLVRQGLRKVASRECDFIITSRLKGFYFNENITIKKIDPSEIETNTPVTSCVKDSDRIKPLGHLKDGLLKNDNANTEHNYGRKDFFKLSTTVLVCAGVVLFLIMHNLDAVKNRYLFSSDFMRAGDYKGCNIAFNALASGVNNIQPAPKIIQGLIHSAEKNNPSHSCQQYPWRYITLLSSPSRIIMFSCRHEIDGKGENSCITTYLRGEL